MAPFIETEKGQIISQELSEEFPAMEVNGRLLQARRCPGLPGISGLSFYFWEESGKPSFLAIPRASEGKIPNSIVINSAGGISTGTRGMRIEATNVNFDYALRVDAHLEGDPQKKLEHVISWNRKNLICHNPTETSSLPSGLPLGFIPFEVKSGRGVLVVEDCRRLPEKGAILFKVGREEVTVRLRQF